MQGPLGAASTQPAPGMCVCICPEGFLEEGAFELIPVAKS